MMLTLKKKAMFKKLILILIPFCLLAMSFDAFAQDTDIQHLEEISDYTETTAKNTQFGFWDALSIALSIAALWFSYFTYSSQKGTEANTKKLSLDAQHNLLKDLIRHLYRNLVITYAIKTKLEDCDYQGYPSEEHLAKLKIPMSNIHLEAFYGKDEEYQKMHNLYLNLRNYNEEIDIVIAHMRNLSLSIDDIERDLGTLMFKPGFLIDKIIDVSEFVWKSDSVREAREQLNRAQNEKRNDKDNIPDQTPFKDFSVSPNHVFNRVFPDKPDFDNFMKKFHEDVEVDRGKNNQNAEKVYIIKAKRIIQ